MAEEGQDPPIDGEGSSRIHIVQPHRDLESNWAVDLAKSLEEYLLKICSGEISGGETANFSINFAEAALLLQGSIQVYSRKVEYLYSLVLQALEFISQKRTQDQEEGPTSQTEASTSRAVRTEDDGQFWCSDDIPVDAKNCLDSLSTKDAIQNRLVKPPANLVVLEGDSVDSTGDGGELETYLLATHDFYRDFILLDPCDATVVDEFLEGNISGEAQYGIHKESSLHTKGHKTFMSPVGQSGGGTARKSTAKKNENNFSEPSAAPCDIDPEPAMCDIPQNGNFDFHMDDHHSVPEFFDDADSDDDDPWKPLNPHEHGNLKVKPFRKVKSPKRQTNRKKATTTTEFPLAKPDGPINPQLKVFWESHVDARKKQQASEPPPYFEKLRQSLLDGAQDIHDMFRNPEGANNDKDFDDGFGDFGFDMPGAFGMDEDDDFNQEKHDDFVDTHNDNAPDNSEDISSQATLEDLCRAHLDSLLASIAETEQQTELVARVTSWKQRIEHNLEEQDSRPPFDIHIYGERVLNKFSMEKDEDAMPFTNVVSGQEKHDVARTFSAMLQLVNEGKIDLDKPAPTSNSFCYTVVNPFYVRCLGKQEEGPDKRLFPQPKKRPNSAIKKRSKQQPSVVDLSSKSLVKSPQKNGKLSAKKLGVPVIGRCTPESKRRRKSRLVDPPDLRSA
ncbi:hypothetical protein V2J09_008679 [Rumex salicifolius]